MTRIRIGLVAPAGTTGIVVAVVATGILATRRRAGDRAVLLGLILKPTSY